ncbi:MAG: enoyl-CoA hydratase/isomerase family protein [Proteobacteria bacterium]|nr:enoyl-CoA hydratase/isomerase family protein [Pseudomonadota bacterium]MBU4597212.1 enoyl-CoA hydratase/isomerase family protein [Pseudomonadota bacterium]
MMKYIDYLKKDQLAYVFLNRSVFNPINYAMAEELAQVWRDFQADPALRVCILGSRSENFCTGFDIETIRQMVEARDYHWSKSVMFGETRVGPQDNGVHKPIVGAYHGVVNATGLWLALQADIILATPQTTFGLGEGLLNFPVEFAGLISRYLPRVIANQLLLTARPLPASRLYEVGAINQIVGPTELLPTAEKIAGQILSCGPAAVEVMKRLTDEAMAAGAEEVGRLTGELAVPVVNSADTDEGVRAFFEKRKPRWGHGGQGQDS